MKQNLGVSFGCSGVRDMIDLEGFCGIDVDGDSGGGGGGGSLFQRMPASLIRPRNIKCSLLYLERSPNAQKVGEALYCVAVKEGSIEDVASERE